jgi:hypothetical protein
MQLSALGAVLGWATTGLAFAALPGTPWPPLAVLVAAAFTVLLLAHLVAFTSRIVAFWGSMRYGAPSEVQMAWPARRVFLLSLLSVTVATLLPPVLGQRAVQAASGAFVGAADLLAFAYPLECTTQELTEAAEFRSNSYNSKVEKVRELIVNELRRDAGKFCDGKENESGCKKIKCTEELKKKRKCRVNQQQINQMITEATVTFEVTVSRTSGRITIDECPCACA